MGQDRMIDASLIVTQGMVSCARPSTRTTGTNDDEDKDKDE